ncbi:MAG: hypothetical protein KDD70_01080 [Bdellovibrionales bacterium]|nr:hypothetical protein [Bdellovibrionales bacterium]
MTLVGIDAGGSKTKVVVTNEDSLRNSSPEEIRDATLPGLNVSTHGLPALRDFLSGLKEDFGIDNPRETKVLGGFAGIETPRQQMEVEEVFTELLFAPENVTAVNDARLLLKVLGNDGVVLGLGTGSFCISEFDGKLFRAGGWGPLLGDEASGFYIGKRAINEATLIHDKVKRSGNSRLVECVCEHFGVSNLQDIIPLLYGRDDNSAQKLAGFAPKVLELADVERDEVAIAIVREAGKSAGQLISAVLTSAKKSNATVGLVGGIFDSKHSGLLREEMEFHLKLSGNGVEFTDLNEGAGREAPLLRAMRNHFNLNHSGNSSSGNGSR